MAKIHARNASLYLEDNTSASQTMSGLMNQITLSYTADAPEVTGFGSDNVERLSNGLKDWELTFSAFYSSAANEVDEVFSGILGGSTVFKLGPAGSSSGSIMYTACGILSEYSMEFSVDGAATVSGTVVARTGSLTRGTWA